MQLYSYQQQAVDELQNHNKGLLTLPTGAGKTVVFMSDAKNRIAEAKELMTFVIVAPRILLSEQLSDNFISFMKDEDIYITKVHSGGNNATTKVDKIQLHSKIAKALNKHHFIFTTYNSLHKVNESEIDIDVVYFDEAHHSVKPSNQVGVAYTSQVADNAYFFTATPMSAMQNTTDIYGNHIVSVSAKDVLSVGTILPPEVEVYEFDEVRTKENAALVDSNNISSIVSQIEDITPKILVAAPSTRIIWESLTHTNLLSELNELGYTVFHITSKYGAYVNKKKVSREVFFNKLNEYGAMENEKIIIFHHSILGEGISVDGLTHCIMLRNLPTIEMLQTVGRVIRVNSKDREALKNQQLIPGQFSMYSKKCGKVIVPVSTGYGKATQKKLQGLINTVFEQGETVFC